MIEKILGYEKREAASVPEFQGLEVGRVIPASLDESKSFIKFNFPVIAVEPGESFVLQNWGAFVLIEINPSQTRLIVRTHGQETPNLLSKIIDYVGELMHYIMERRMLLGFKSQIETGAPVSSKADNLWLLGLVLSAIGITLMVFVGEGFLNGLLAAIFGVVWLWVLLILDPRPMFSMAIFLVSVGTFMWLNVILG